MYAWIFRHLPGPTWFKIVEAILIFLLVLAALIQWVFPWIQSIIQPDPSVSAMTMVIQ